MDKPLELLVVAQTFWPIVNDQAMRLQDWCEQLATRNIRVHVLTPRWNRNDAANGEFRSFQVTRLLPAPTTSWQQVQFLRQVSKWLNQNLTRFDGVFLNSPDAVAPVVIRCAARHQKPTIGYLSINPLKTIRSVQNKASRGGLGTVARQAPQLSVYQECDLIIAADAESERQLLMQRIATDRVQRIDFGCHRIPDRSSTRAERRQKARFALGNLSGDFFVAPEQQLVVYYGPIDDGDEFRQFANATGGLIDRDFPVHAWCFGKWEQVSKAHDFLHQRCWHRNILIHGQFDEPQSVFDAADLVVLPCAQTLQDWTLPYLDSHGIPTLTNRWVQTNSQATSHDLFQFGEMDSDDDCSLQMTKWYDNIASYEANAAKKAERFARYQIESSKLDHWAKAIRQLLENESINS